MHTEKDPILGSFFPNDRDLRYKFIASGIVGILALATLAILLSFWQIVAIVLSILFLIVTIYRPRWTLMFLLIWMPFEPFLLKFVPDVLFLYARFFSEVLIYLLAAIVVVKIGIGKKQWKQTPLDLPFILFVLVLIASVLVNTVSPTIAILGIRQILRFVILFFVVALMYPPKEFIRRAVVAMLLIVILQSALGITQSLVGGNLDSFLLPSETRTFETLEFQGVTEFWDPGSRVFGTLGRYDRLGTFLVFFMLIAIGFLYEKEVWQDRKELLLVLALGLPALLLTYSRSSWFGLLLGFLLIALYFMRDRRVWIGFIIFLSMVFGYLFFSGVVVQNLIETRGVEQSPVERFFEAFSYERWQSEYYGFGRLYFIVQTPRAVIAAAPLFGVGPGQYGGGAAATLHNITAYDELGLPFGVEGTRGIIDNNWFSLWGETGTLGLAFYLWMYAALFIITVKVYRDSTDPLARGLALGFAGAMLAVALNSFLATFLEVRTLAIYLWVFGGFVFVLGRRQKLV